MTRDVRVHLLPALFEPEEVRGGVAVILDILRASTTIVHALAHGARCVIPTVDVPTAQALAASFPAGSVLLGGEREGVLIPGFDLDNSPFAYSAAVVAGKTIVFTTTNGTAALQRAVQAERVLIGSFVNLQAVVNILAEDGRPAHLVCAGTRGKITIEDALAAGAIVDRLLAEFGRRDEDLADDQAQLALAHYVSAAVSEAGLRRALRNGAGGRNCRRLGFDAQIDRAATLDLFDIVPEYDRQTGQIASRPMKSSAASPAALDSDHGQLTTDN